jgi:hypothetical protein
MIVRLFMGLDKGKEVRRGGLDVGPAHTLRHVVTPAKVAAIPFCSSGPRCGRLDAIASELTVHISVSELLTWDYSGIVQARTWNLSC